MQSGVLSVLLPPGISIWILSDCSTFPNYWLIEHVLPPRFHIRTSLTSITSPFNLRMQVLDFFRALLIQPTDEIVIIIHTLCPIWCLNQMEQRDVLISLQSKLQIAAALKPWTLIVLAYQTNGKRHNGSFQGRIPAFFHAERKDESQRASNGLRMN